MEHAESIDKRVILLGDGRKLYATHRGRLELRTYLDNAREYERILVLDRALYVPELHTNLLSCSALDRDEYKINIKAGRCNGVKSVMLQFFGKEIDRFYNMCKLSRSGKRLLPDTQKLPGMTMTRNSTWNCGINDSVMRMRSLFDG